MQSKWLSGFLTSSGLEEEPLPGVPLVELSGDRRVLIENHRGICEYSQEQVTVRVTFGWILVTGQCLTVQKMTKEQLVVRGCIQDIRVKKEEFHG